MRSGGMTQNREAQNREAQPAPAEPDARIVIVGAGHAGGAAAALLRQYGHPGPVTLIGAEESPPYHRPPLSKAYLKDAADSASLKLKPDAFYAEAGITLRMSAQVTGIDRAARHVVTEGGEPIPYDILILATGSRNRRPDCAPPGMKGVHELRSLADADGLKAALRPQSRLAIIGGGYIGLEAAASARALGAETVVLEREARILSRTASPDIAQFFTAHHRAQGAEVVTGAHIVALETGPDGAVRACMLADGRRVECNAVLIGAGALAEDTLARAAGLSCDGGVVVDIHARSSDPAIFAIGDMTQRPLPLYENRRFRLESAPNALEQARQAAAAITGRPPPGPETPWFWSDQYDLKLQIAGLPFEADETVIRGAPESGRFAVFHLKQGQLRAVEAVNSGADFMAGRGWIAAGARPDPARLADPDIPLRGLAG